MIKLDFIIVLLIAFVGLVFLGYLDAPISFNQLLGYICIHSIGVVLITSQIESTQSFILKIVILIGAASILLLNYGDNSTTQPNAGKLMIFVLFLLNNWFLIIGTKLFLRAYKSDIRKLSIFRYFVICSNMMFLYIYIAYPSYLYASQWWVLTGIFYVPYIEPVGIEFWISTFIISTGLIVLTMVINKQRELNV